MILSKYRIDYFKCDNCGFIQTEEPYWLEEAYKSPISISDTGLVQRNIYLSKKVAILLYFIFGKNETYLDYAGGHGVFTRLMRDIGFDFYHYEPYTENLFAKGFEDNHSKNYKALTAFEVFEHFANPIEEIEKMLKFSQNIIFTTELLPNLIPKPNDWWYYGLDHGQHVSFYSYNTFIVIAERFKKKFWTNGRIHILTDKKISPIIKLILKLEKYGLLKYMKRKIVSKTQTDYEYLKQDLLNR